MLLPRQDPSGGIHLPAFARIPEGFARSRPPSWENTPFSAGENQAAVISDKEGRPTRSRLGASVHGSVPVFVLWVNVFCSLPPRRPSNNSPRWAYS